MRKTIIHGLLFFSYFLLISCSITLFPVEHTSYPEVDNQQLPTGKYYERNCLKKDKAYTLQVKHAVLYGRVLSIKESGRLAQGRKEALSPEDTISFLVQHVVTDSTNYLHSSNEDLMNGYGFHFRDSMSVTNLRHGDISSFNCFGKRKKAHVTYEANSLLPSKHAVIQDWQGKHLCPMQTNHSYLFYVTPYNTQFEYAILFGKIIVMNDDAINRSLTIELKNELNSGSSLHGLTKEEIMTHGIGFPKNFTPVTLNIPHDQITVFKPASKVSSHTKVPQSHAGQTAGATLLLLALMVYGVISLFAR